MYIKIYVWFMTLRKYIRHAGIQSVFMQQIWAISRISGPFVPGAVAEPR